MQHERLSTVLVKPAGPACNLACSYCFYLPKQSRFSRPSRMSAATLEAMTRQLVAQPLEEVTFSWQGGEPTLMGPAFFREAVRLQRRHARPSQRVRNTLMTNGLALDPSWCQLLREAEFLVGLSLDGPRDVHDAYRCGPGGAATWERVERAARLLLTRGVAVNAVVVATERSCRRGAEIYRYLTDLGFEHLQIVPCVEPDPQRPGQLTSASVSPEGYGQLLCDLFDCWSEDFMDGVPKISVRWLDGVLHHYLGFPPTECTLSDVCGRYLVVEHDGSVYSCDFYVDDDHHLGNLHEQQLADMFRSGAHRAFGRSKSALPAGCRECRWRSLCEGGCPKNRPYRADGRTVLCESYQQFFEYADERLTRLAARWLERQSSGREPQAKVGRNQPCPCGSGKKHKHCCGR